MKIGTKLAVVNAAEADCSVRRAAIGAAWRGFKQQAEVAATPKRVIIAGLVSGFLAGLPRIGDKGSGSLLGGKILGLAMETAFTSISAAIAAGAAAANATQGTQPEPAAPGPSSTREGG